MAYDLFTGSPDDPQAKVAYFMQLFGQVRSMRVNFETQWEETASLCWPEYRNSFAFGHNRPPGMKYTEFQVDTAGSIASHRFMAICDALLTPHTMLWSKVKASNDDLMKDRSVQLYFAKVSQVLWQERYKAEANFLSQNQQNWQSLGVFGNMGMLIDQLDPRPGNFGLGLRYMSTSPGEMFVLQNHQGRVDGYIRYFRWTARQAYQKWGDKIPEALSAALAQNSQVRYDFLQFVIPRTDYDPYKMLAPQGMPWSSTYISVVGYQIMEEGGYRSFPWAAGRYLQAPEEDYGRGPGQMVLPELKTLNAERSDFLKQGHRAGDPTYLIADDGLIDFKSEPGAYNFGGMNSKGQKLVDILPVGNIQTTEEMMAMSNKAVDDAFLVSLFPLLFGKDAPTLNPRQVIEQANEKGIFLAPILGRQYGEYVSTMIDRELDLLSYMKKLPKQPPALKEARGEYGIEYSGPLGRSVLGQAIAGYFRTVEMAGEVVKLTGDPSVMDRFDFDASIPAIAEAQFSPTAWMASDEKVAAKRKQRDQAAERQNQVKEMPGRAAIMKAQAISAKAQAGQNIGGTLSNTQQGGMPMMPGQTQPGGTPPPNFGGP